jgi:HK97 gp10 family phage protein
MIEFAISGLDGIDENLKMMCTAVRERILRDAVRKGATAMMTTAKVYCSAETGTLRDSISLKMVSPKKGVAVQAIIGPKSGIKVPVRVVTKGKNAGKIMIAVPTYYAHFIEFGHKLVIHGQELGFVSPRPFMRPAFDDEWENALDIIVLELVNGVENELAKTYRYP